MQYVQLGKTSLNVSRIGFGCMSLKPGAADNERIIHEAIECGINYFDTADLYDRGMNEEMLGKALRSKRDRVIIATKVGNRMRDDGSGWDWDASKDHILSSVEGSLKRLSIEQIDLYQLHGGTMDDNIDEAIEAFELLTRQGKIRHYGISSIRPNVIREWVKRSNIVSVMMQYSLLDRRPEEECLSFLRDHGIAVMVRGALAQGLLVDKAPKEYLGRTEAEVAKAKEIIQQYSSSQRTPAQTAMQFVLHHDAVSTVVAGIRTMEQMQEAVGTMDAKPLTEEEFAMISEVVVSNRYKDHR